MLLHFRKSASLHVPGIFKWIQVMTIGQPLHVCLVIIPLMKVPIIMKPCIIILED